MGFCNASVKASVFLKFICIVLGLLWLFSTSYLETHYYSHASESQDDKAYTKQLITSNDNKHAAQITSSFRKLLGLQSQDLPCTNRF